MNMGNWAKNPSPILWDRVAPDCHGLPLFAEVMAAAERCCSSRTGLAAQPGSP